MAEQSIISTDMTLEEVFQGFYRVPDYQREYVWGERNDKNERGEEVELFLKDIHREFEEATDKSAPEYFIGTIVVCPSPDDGVFDLIDGQQRTTTAYLTLCVIRDVLKERGEKIPDVLSSQIAAEKMNWKSELVHRLRLDLQYEDAGGVLHDYAVGKATEARRTGTRSITNIGNAYDTIREFLTTQFKDDPTGVLRYYAYLTNKVKLIRIQTPNVDKALKIFETINDRGVGLDAMDLLKNLLFLHAKPESFAKLKGTWKAITDEIYSAQEKPLRFLRYFILATYDVEGQIREDDIYDWFTKNDKQTNHTKNPVGFAEGLLMAAKAYRQFVGSQNVLGAHESGLANTRSLGGKAIRQHFIFFLAARQLPPAVFARLAFEVENLMFVWMMTNTPTKDYERAIIEAANQLRSVKDAASFDVFKSVFFDAIKNRLAAKFYEAMLKLHSYDTRAFRIKYLLAKLTQHVDLEAYGSTGARLNLAHYTDGGNDIEHILPDTPSVDALQEFGESVPDNELIQRLGNLMLIEKSVNRALGNKPYSAKIGVYPSSQFLLARCQAEYQKVGVNDQITKTMNWLETFPRWDRKAIQRRQLKLASIALKVWGVAYAIPLPVAREPLEPLDEDLFSINDWERKALTGDFSAVPLSLDWKHSSNLAMFIEGYDIVGGQEPLIEIMNRMRETAARSGYGGQSAKNLWLSLFAEWRADYWSGGYGQSKDEIARLDALCRALAAALRNATADERNELVPLFKGVTVQMHSRELIGADGRNESEG